MPQITIKAGEAGPEGTEETLTEYFCDFPGCWNVATQVLGYARGIGVASAVCDSHAANKPA